MGAAENQARALCDDVAGEVAMSVLLPEVDEVHVMASLTGFEALLRGKPVTCYGQPFYAGRGLTQDKAPIPRRNRRLALDELVAGVLLHYPHDVSDTSGEFTSAEWTVERLAMLVPATRPLQKNMLGRFVRTGRAFIGGALRELRTRPQG